MLAKSVLAMLLIAGSVTGAAAQTTDDLLTPEGVVSAKGLAQYCASDIQEERYFCYGYVAASINYLGISGELMRMGEGIDLVAICPKDNANVAKNIGEFVTWMQDASPDRRDGRAAIAIAEFLRGKYPCP